MSNISERELRAWQGLLHAHQQVTRVLDAELRAEHALSLADYDVLVRLARAPDRRLKMTDLAHRVMMSPSGLTRAVDRLEERGLVRRDRADGDARLMLAQLTDRGRHVVRQAARTHLRGVREHFTTKLSPSELDSVGRALERVTGPHEPH
jgi:DNA-binding MarR family transcriptional regulator